MRRRCTSTTSASRRGTATTPNWPTLCAEASPGLHSFFHDWLGPLEEEGQAAVDAYPGLIEFLRELDRAVRDGRTVQSEADANASLEAIPIDPYVISTSIDSLHLMKAGAFDSQYPERVNTFD